MNKVAVVMSTYNGEKYLAEQIDSIMNQEGVNVFLYVRDDGSSDGTKAILRSYESIHSNMIVEFGENIGVGNSFMTALYHARSDFDYYAFADQDDVWLSDKLSAAVEFLQSEEGIALYVSNQLVADGELNNRHSIFECAPDMKFGSILRGNTLSGCTFVFNKMFFEFLNRSENRPSGELLKIRIHDVWVSETAALFGKILYDKEPHMLYRQHTGNVVGAREFSFLVKLRLRLKWLVHPNKGSRRLAEELLRVFGNRLGANRPILETYCVYRSSLSQKWIMLRSGNIFRHDHESVLEYWLKILINRL